MRRQSIFAEIKDWVTEQPNSRLIISVLIIIGAGYVVFGFGYGKEYHEQVNEELELAKMICETSADFIQRNPERLKHGKSELNKLTYNGERIKLEHVKYPEIIFLESGFVNLNRTKSARDVFCYYSDPRDSSADYYYNYETKLWQDKVRFRN